MAKPDTDVFDVPWDEPGSDPDPWDVPEEEERAPVITGNGTRSFAHPITGKWTTSTRASKFASTGADDFTLDEWKRAMVVLGLGERDDLHAEAQSLALARPSGPVENYPKGWWLPASEIAHEAIDAARGRSGAHKGTAVHRLGETLDRGHITIDEIPARYREHLRHYQAARAAAGLSVHPDYIETGVFTDKLHNGVNGRLDNLLTAPGGWLMVGDLKTGRDAPMGMDEIAIQLAIYANAEWHIDLDTGECTPAPENIRKDVAVIVWVPIDRPELAEVIPVDISWGWQAARVIAWMKAYRNRAKRKNNGLRMPLSVITDVEPYPALVGIACANCGTGDWTRGWSGVCPQCRDYYERNGV